MALQAIAFYLLAFTTLAAGLLVVSARNPVHSVLFLITAFFSAAGLFVLLGAEFLAMLLIVVYVGAVAVLFLFVVMMLDIDFAELRAGFVSYLPFGLLIALVLLAEIVLGIGLWSAGPIELAQRAAPEIRSARTNSIGLRPVCRRNILRKCGSLKWHINANSPGASLVFRLHLICCTTASRLDLMSPMNASECPARSNPASMFKITAWRSKTAERSSISISLSSAINARRTTSAAW